MKKKMIALLLLLSLLAALCVGCGNTAGEAEETEIGPLEEAQTTEEAGPEEQTGAAQPGIEEDDCEAFAAVSDFASAVQDFVEDAGYVFETTTTTGKSNLYTICDGAEDLLILRAYITEDENIDHFFLKWSYSWAVSDDDFAFAQRLVKFAVKSAVPGLDNGAYDEMCAAVGLGTAEEMKTLAQDTTAFGGEQQWDLTKNTGSLQTKSFVSDAASYELGVYTMTKSTASEPNYYVLTVTPASAGTDEAETEEAVTEEAGADPSSEPEAETAVG